MAENGNDLYEGIAAIMERYISPITVRSTLSNALRRLGLEAAQLTPRDLPELVAEAMTGMKVFCDRERLPELQVDLADYCVEAAESSGSDGD